MPFRHESDLFGALPRCGAEPESINAFSAGQSHRRTSGGEAAVEAEQQKI